MSTPSDLRAAAETVLTLTALATVTADGRVACETHPRAGVVVDVFLSAPHVALSCRRCGLRLAESERAPVASAPPDVLTRARAALDVLTRARTEFASFEEMLLDAAPDYVPTLPTSAGPGVCAGEARENARLADAYDAAMSRRGDPRRAWRG